MEEHQISNMPYISCYQIHWNIKCTLFWNLTPCSLAGTHWRSPHSQTWQLQMLKNNVIQWAKLTLYYCICQLFAIENSDFLRFTSFRKLALFSNFSWYISFEAECIQGSKSDISLSSICSNTFLLWYSLMIHKGYFPLPSLAQRTCSTSHPIYCPSVWLW